MKHVVHDHSHPDFWVVTTPFQQGESWTLEPHGVPAEAGLLDTSGHITLYMDGTFRAQYGGQPPIVRNARSMTLPPQTGRKDRHPTGPVTVTCLQEGRMFHIIRRGPETPLDFQVLGAGAQATLPKPGFLVYFDELTLREASGTVTMNAPGLVFWEV